MAHSTAPFITSASISRGLSPVLGGEYDSAFSVERIQTFAWCHGEPINYYLNDVPRTQDIEPVFVETSGFYVFEREVLIKHGRRIGDKPKMVEVSREESIDIDELVDYEAAKRLMGE